MTRKRSERPATGATGATGAPTGWDVRVCANLIDSLWTLRRAMLERQAQACAWIDRVDAAHRASAINLVHYLAMRRHDLRELQQGLAQLGLSSLGGAESHALASVDKVLGILHRLAGRPWTPLQADEPAGSFHGPALLQAHAQALLGASPAGRGVRIMVTLPSEAAHDGELVEAMVAAGMDLARINCAHDSASEWIAMAGHVRSAAQRAGRPVRVLMDLGGPKLRTGAVRDGPQVLKLQPRRDALGRVTAPWTLALRTSLPSGPEPDGLPALRVDPDWLGTLALRDRLACVDARGARRAMTVTEVTAEGVRIEGRQTTYLIPDTRLHPKGHPSRDTRLGGIAATAGRVLLQRGQRIRLIPIGAGRDAVGEDARGRRRATVVCTLAEALGRVRTGDRVWFDDGRIGGVVRRRQANGVTVDITSARVGGERLGADKGINLPDTELDLPALTAKDLRDLPVVAQHADLVGLSFANRAEDVRTLRAELEALGAGHLGMLLKVETKAGFEHLPEMLLAALSGPVAGVMIARGDLAVECGFERLAEVQEEILWACEAAHVPVVWATQVLETLAKTGLPSRAEITDAAMGERAECVMLNKGPHIGDAIRALDDILRRMQAHQSKKQPLLRALGAWNGVPGVQSGALRHKQ